jgi:hypothetical protein
VQGPGIHPEFGVLAFADAGRRVQPGDQGVTAGAGVRAAGISGEFFEFGGVHALLDVLGEVDEHVGAHGLEDVDAGAERDPVLAVVPLDKRRVLEVFRSHAHDDVTARAGRLHFAPHPVTKPEVPERGAQHAVLEGAGHEVHGG